MVPDEPQTPSGPHRRRSGGAASLLEHAPGSLAPVKEGADNTVSLTTPTLDASLTHTHLCACDTQLCCGAGWRVIDLHQHLIVTALDLEEIDDVDLVTNLANLASLTNVNRVFTGCVCSGLTHHPMQQHVLSPGPSDELLLCIPLCSSNGSVQVDNEPLALVVHTPNAAKPTQHTAEQV